VSGSLMPLASAVADSGSQRVLSHCAVAPVASPDCETILMSCKLFYWEN
jgi:hypothetical protein